MRLVFLVTVSVFCAASVTASEWSREESDGVLVAAVNLGELDYIEALCDVGIDIPITSISFMIHGNLPDPLTMVEFRFGKQSRIFASIDEEGVIPSATKEDGETFDRLIEAMKTKSELVIRLPSGVRQTFPLDGSEAALEGCQADMHKLAVIEGS